MSGEALTNTASSGFAPLTAIDDCVRLWARTVPLRTPSQFRQLQFHCGKPPPAAEPSTRIFKVSTKKPAACAGFLRYRIKS